MNKRKMIGLIASLVAAALGTFAILQYSKGKSTPPVAAPAEPMVTVLKVSKDIPKGTPAAALTDYVTPTQVPASAKQPNAAESVAEVADMVANTDLYVGDQLSKLRFSSPAQVAASTPATDASDPNNGLLGVWVSVDALRALNGRFTPGATKVAVVAVFPPLAGTGGDPTAAVPSNHLILHHVPILDVWPPVATVMANAAAAPTTTMAPGATGPAPAPTLQIKLGVDAPSAERLIYAVLNGSIYLAEEPDSAPSDAPTKIVERSNVYIATPPVTPNKPAIVSTPDATGTTDTTKPTAKPAAGTATTVKPAAVVTTVKPAAVTAPTLAGATVSTAKPGTPVTTPAAVAAVAGKP